MKDNKEINPIMSYVLATTQNLMDNKVNEVEKVLEKDNVEKVEKVKARRRCIEGVNYLITSSNLVYLESSKELVGSWCVESESIIPMSESDSESDNE